MAAAFLTTVLILSVATSVVRSLSCATCDKSNCKIPTCAGGRVPDPCQCCFVCAKQVNETCGGAFAIDGQCDMKLSCIIQPSHGKLVTGREPGICKPTNSLESSDLCHEGAYYDGCNIVGHKCECGRQIACSNPHQFQNIHQCRLQLAKLDDMRQRCAKTLCIVQQSPECPGDSELEEGYAPAGECCPLPSRCVCNPERCPEQLCRPNFDRVLVKRGTNRPGSCCDVYECRAQEVVEINECAMVRCAPPPLDSVRCPNDSTPARAIPTPNECCPPITCQCQKDQCVKPVCPQGTSARVSFRGDGKPGSCCDVYVCSSENVHAGCSVNGTLHNHKTTYERDQCRICECKNGVSYCERRECPVLPCALKTMRQGDCCATCVDSEVPNPVDYPYEPYPMCRSDDGLSAYQVGDSWKTDACTVCRCEEGGIRRCKAAYCPTDDPRPTITVPVCPELDNCKLQLSDCPYGFKYDSRGCRVCQCLPELCPSLAHCKISCPRGFQKDEAGCSVCKCKSAKCKDLTSCKKECPYGYKKNKHGCDRCRCKRCPPLKSCEKECMFGRETNVYGCPICKCKEQLSTLVPARKTSKSCVDSVALRKRDDGETWSSNCYICSCRHGDVVCDLLKCPVLACRSPVQLEGHCCPVCESVAFTNFSIVVPPSLSCQEPDGIRRVEGETWKVDNCTSCTCQSGYVMCSSTSCPPTPCSNPVRRNGKCCPTCEDLTSDDISCLDDDGKPVESGSTWRSDMCTSCVCLGGVIRCVSESCPTIHNCNQPVLKNGKCCPECLEPGASRINRTCTYDGMLKENGEIWTSNDGCGNCSCLDGKATCSAPVCPELRLCESIRKMPGLCCDLCEDIIKNPTDIPGPAEASFNWMPLAAGICAAIVLGVVAVLTIVCVKRRNPRPGSTKKSANSKTPKGTEPERQKFFNRSQSTTTTRTPLCSSSSHADELGNTA